MSNYKESPVLEYIHQIAQENKEIRNLIEAKNNGLLDLKNKGTISFKKLTPAPSPMGDKRHLKNHKGQIMDEKLLKEKMNIFQAKYDTEIKNEMDNILKQGEPKIVKDTASKMSPKELATLCEKGGQTYIQEKKADELIKKESLKINLDDIVESKKITVHRDFHINEKSMKLDKSISPSDNFE